MKKYLRFTWMVVCAALLGVNLTSCEKDAKVSEDTERETAYAAILKQYVDVTIGSTYAALADEAETLANRMAELKTEKTDAKIAEVCETFKATRALWEQSEAFLFGAASDFSIDPHIDSWPLSLTDLNRQLENVKNIEAMGEEDGDVWAKDNLGASVLGFHGVEYILFRDGKPRKASEITDNEVIFATAVAGDLRNHCYQLEVSWLGDKAKKAHRDKMEELEMNVTISDGTYAENLLNAGQAGSTYRSKVAAVQQIVDGCMTIADEVAASKIGKPFTGEDESYVESPYSHNSITDFYNNIVSIENAYMGGPEKTRSEALSIHNYLKNKNAALDKEVVDAINNAKMKIKAMKAPFVNNIKDASAGAAVEACNALTDALTKAKAELAK